MSSVVALILHRSPVPARWASGLVAASAGAVGAIVSLDALRSGVDQRLELFRSAPFAPMSVRLDPLAAWFLLLISLVALAVCLGGIGYTRAYDHHGGPRLSAVTGIFLASMSMVVLADSAFAFLIGWEVMSLASFLLVIHEHHEAGVGRTGYVYLAMTHCATAFVTVVFLTLSAASGGLGFEGFKASAGFLHPQVRDALFLLGVVGFGTKAGMIPLHVWLPRAHPVAPSHVSALMSGVMLKMGIYGLVRLTWDILSGGPAWWGALLLGLGVVSAVMGVLYALMEHDLKRLLAFHSVENIGIILIGLGAGLSLAGMGQPVAASVAIAAGLFHTLNHALFKALLFLGAGAVQQSTGTRDLEQLGGLVKTMPVTAGLFLLGAMAISALPPLNGFASEWLTFQGLLSLALSISSPWLQVSVVLAGGLLGMTGALAAACFVKAFGVGFLGLPRSPLAANGLDAPRSLQLGMAVLAALCLLLGLQPGLALTRLDVVVQSLGGAPLPANNVSWTTSLVTQTGTLLNPSLLLASLLISVAAIAVMFRLAGPVTSRRAPAWVCGFALEPGMQYGSTAFAKPIRLFFRALVRPERVILTEESGLPFFHSRVSYHAGIRPVYETSLYHPLVRALLGSATRLRGIQSGSLRLYLGYIFATLVVLLLWAR